MESLSVMVTPIILSDVTRSMPDKHGGRLKARLLRRQSVTIISLDFWRLSVRLFAFAQCCIYVVELGASRVLVSSRDDDVSIISTELVSWGYYPQI